MNKQELREIYSNLSPNYRRILTKYRQDPIKFASNKSWAQPIIDALTVMYPNVPQIEALFQLKSGLEKAPTCLNCSANLPFLTEPTHHYGKFCNNTCSAQYRENSKKG